MRRHHSPFAGNNFRYYIGSYSPCSIVRKLARGGPLAAFPHNVRIKNICLRKSYEDASPRQASQDGCRRADLQVFARQRRTRSRSSRRQFLAISSAAAFCRPRHSSESPPPSEIRDVRRKFANALRKQLQAVAKFHGHRTEFWKVLPERTSDRIKAAEGDPVRSRNELMTNPSRSGRGKSLKE
jgi:hypothetical protein